MNWEKARARNQSKMCRYAYPFHEIKHNIAKRHGIKHNAANRDEEKIAVIIGTFLSGSAIMFLKEVSKIQDRRLIGDVATGGPQLCKITNRGAVVEFLLHHRIWQVEPLLYEVDA